MYPYKESFVKVVNLVGMGMGHKQQLPIKEITMIKVVPSFVFPLLNNVRTFCNTPRNLFKFETLN